jgi:uncharacterized protein (DUF934 family)
MAKLIRNRSVVPDNWQPLSERPEDKAAIPAEGDVIVPLATWLAEREALCARTGRTGVLLDGAQGPEALAQDLERIPLVAVHFASFGDGRGLSTARLLRERYGYTGTLRAVGQVIHDWLLFMERCGFDEFVLRDGEDAERALAAFAELPDAYQATVAEPQPLFRRRLAGLQG